MTVILQISDPHFGTERPEVVEALIELSHQLTPDLLVVSGDITQRARRAQFAAAAKFVERLRVPHVLAIPGNHDVPLFNVLTRAIKPYAGYERVFGADLEPRFRAPDCLLLAVKTTRRYRHVDGEVSRAQRERVAAHLREATDEQLRVVVTHQPLGVPRKSEEKNVLHGHLEAARAWSEAGADVVLSGHIHLPFVLPLHETMGLPRPLWGVSAGTAISSRVRHDAGNSVNVVRTSHPPRRGRCTVEHWTFASAGAAFARSSELEIGRAVRDA